MKLFISPSYRGIDPGSHGGIRRIIDHQREYFASSIVDDVENADTVAIHAGSVVRLRADQKVVAHCHGLYWSKYTQWDQPADEINKSVIQALKLSDFITAPTEWVANSIRRGMYRTVDVVPHAVDPEWQPSSENKGYVLWNKSRVDRVCDPEPVYKVAAMLLDIDFRLTVGVSKSKNITITGLTPYADKAPVQEASVYLATAQETFGIGILEALACGIPVVGWNWGGQAEILPRDWLAQEGDYTKLAELIQWAIDNHDNLREQCLEIAAQYTWQNAMEKYEEIYSRSIDTERRISVVIRNYNQSDLLAQCIESVIPQATEQDEVVVLDDCSTDDSEQVAAKYLDKITWLKTPHNLGVALAQDYGISRAKGKYIVPIDSDNMITPNTLKLLSDGLDADRSIDIAYGRVQWIGLQSNWPPNVFNLDAQLSHKNQIPCTAMFRRKVYEVAGPYRARCRVAEDADFWCRATSLGFVAKKVTEAETLVYRVRQGSTSQTVKDWPWENWHNKDAFVISNKANSCEPILVSVIIPVGPGHELLLQDALDSLYVQTFKNWECIVVNDTGNELPWTPPWVKIIETEGSAGPAIARNMGLEIAKGKLWIPLDADDYLTATAIADMLLLWQKNQHHYIYTDFYKNQYVHNTPNIVCNVLKTQMPHILTGLYPVVSGVQFETMIAEDWDFALQMQQAGYCGVRLDKPVVRYRVESGNRREQFNQTHKQFIIDKWKDVEMAGCSSCAQRAAAIQRALNSPMADSNDVVLVEYTGTETKRYYPGVSGRTYAFGTGQGLQEKYVLSEDVGVFANKPNFTIHSNVESDTPIPV